MNKQFQKVCVKIVCADGVMNIKGKNSLKPYLMLENAPGLLIPTTGIKTHSGKNDSKSIWNELFLIGYDIRNAYQLDFKVFDKNTFSKDTLIGVCTFYLETLAATPVQNIWIPVKMKNEGGKGTHDNGKINFIFTAVVGPLANIPIDNISPELLFDASSQTQINPGFLYPITCPSLNIGLGWDFNASDVFDLDASIIALNETNNQVETVFFNHRQAFNGGIKHHGDNLTGEGDGDDEVISLDLNKIPNNVTTLAVLINSYKKNSIIKAKTAYIRLFKNKFEKIGMFLLARTKDCIGLLLGLFQRKIGTNEWVFRSMVDPLEGNTAVSSLSSLQKILTNYSYGTKVMTVHPIQGETVFTPQTWFKLTSPKVFVGLGWDFTSGNILDLDSSIITFNQKNEINEIIYYGNPESLGRGIIHQGDNKTGEGEGDDEIISIDFNLIKDGVCSMAICVNSFKGISLLAAKAGFVRLFTKEGPFGCHLLTQGNDTTGLLLGLFRKKPEEKDWYFQVMINPVRGNNGVESSRDILALLNQYPLNA